MTTRRDVPEYGEVLSEAGLSRVADRLASVGLNRCAATPIVDLSSEVWLGGDVPPAIDSGGGPDGATLLLVGHGGRALWRYLHETPDFDFDRTPDPIDTFSAAETESVLAAEFPAVTRRLLYPGPDCPVDLVALGAHLGWQAPSPLGLGIDPEFGLWSAYRALWLLSASIESGGSHTLVPAPEVCRSCVPQSCVEACPAGAVVVGQSFALMDCIDHRSKRDSSCAETCLSRWACPVAKNHRYQPDQMAYHYRLSRPPIVG